MKISNSYMCPIPPSLRRGQLARRLHACTDLQEGPSGDVEGIS